MTRSNGSVWLALVLLGVGFGCGGGGRDRDDAGADGGADAGAGADAEVVLADAGTVVATTPGLREYQFEHDGLTRSYLLYIPVGYGHSDLDLRPLLVVLHGGGGKAAQMFGQHPLQAGADSTGFIIVAAQGTPKDDGGNGWNNSPLADDGIDDVGYLERVIVDLSAALKVNPRRRYMAGFSGGATMTVRFASEKSAYLAAIHTFAGKVGRSVGATPPFVFPPAPATPLSVQMTYGTEDDNFTGGVKDGIAFSSGREGIDWWVRTLGCSPTPTTMVTGKVTTDSFSGCMGGNLVRMITVQGMGHMWPNRDDGLDGTLLMLDFLRDKTMP